MYISKKELLKIAKDHELRGYINYTKPQLFAMLRVEGLLPEGADENEKDPNRYNFVKGIRNGRKVVLVDNLENRDTNVYFSIYKCAKALGINPGIVRYYNNKTYNNNFRIRILEPPYTMLWEINFRE